MEVMHDLETHVRGFNRPPFRLNAEFVANAMLTFQNRRRLMLTNLLWARAMLNLFLCGWAPLHKEDYLRIIIN